MIPGSAIPFIFAAYTTPPGQVEFTSAGTHSWTAPPGIKSVCVVCVGAGGNGASVSAKPGGEGGGLGWKNNISVVPGQSYTVVVGAAVSDSNVETSYFISAATVSAKGGAGGDTASVGSRTTGCGTYVGDGGGLGGYTTAIAQYGHGGCGAAGYSGDGGNASNNADGSAGSGGGGGAGGDGGTSSSDGGGGGGGVGLQGEGANGTGGINNSSTNNNGKGGSGGSDGGLGTSSVGGAGGGYGGGGGQRASGAGGAGADGAVRIIWGAGRAFPSTNTADV